MIRIPASPWLCVALTLTLPPSLSAQEPTAVAPAAAPSEVSSSIKLDIRGPIEVAVGETAVLKAVVPAGAVASVPPEAWIQWVLDGAIIKRGETLEYSSDHPGVWQMKANLLGKDASGEKVLGTGSHMLMVTREGPRGFGAAQDAHLRWTLQRKNGQATKNIRDGSNTVSLSGTTFLGIHEEPCVGTAASTVSWAEPPAAFAPGTNLATEISEVLEMTAAAGLGCDTNHAPVHATVTATFSAKYGKQNNQSMVSISEIAKAPVDSYRKSKSVEWRAPSGKAGDEMTIEIGVDCCAGSVEQTYRYALQRVEPPRPLVVELKADRTSALPGDEVHLSVTATGGKEPYRFAWSGDDSIRGTTGQTAVLSSRSAGDLNIDVAVTDAEGRTATGRTSVAVVSLQVQLALDPPEPLVGEEVTAKAMSTPEPGGADFRWLDLPANAKLVSKSGDGREIRFCLKDDQPADVGVEMHAPGGKLLASTRKTVAAKAYRVALTGPLPGSPSPRLWQPGVGMIRVTNAIAVQQNLSFVVSLVPEPRDTAVKYEWTVSSRSCAIVSPTPLQVQVVCTETGTYSVTVVARDSKDVDLGTATASFAITISEQDLEDARKQALAAKLADEAVQFDQAGKRDAALERYQDSFAAWKDAGVEKRIGEIESAAVAEKDRKRKFAELVRAGHALEEQGDLSGAVAKYKEGLATQADDRLANHIALVEQAQQERTAKKAQAAKLRSEAAAHVEQGRFDEAIRGFEDSLELDPNAEVETQLHTVEARQAEQEAKKNRAAKLRDEAYAAEQDGNLDQALAKGRESLSLWPDDDLKKHLQITEQMLATQTAKQAQARQLKEDGLALEKKGELEAAVAALERSVSLWPDGELKKHVEGLETAVSEQKDKQKKANSLRLDAEAFEQQGSLDKALPMYTESLGVWSNAELAAHVADLKRNLEAREKKLVDAKRLRDEAELLERQENDEAAVAKYKESLSLQPDHDLESHVLAVETLLAARKTNEVRAKQFRDDGAAAEKQHDLETAIVRYDESLKLQANAELQAHVRSLEATLTAKHAEDEQAKKYRDDGAGLERQESFELAVASYRKSLAVEPDAGLEKHVAELEAQIASRKAKAAEDQATLAEQEKTRAQAQELAKQGYQLEQQGDIDGAIARHKESLAIWRDDQLAAHVSSLEGAVAARKADEAKATKLRAEGQAFEEQHAVDKALLKYDESLGIRTDKALADHVAELKRGLEEREKKLVEAKRLRDDGTALEQADKAEAAIAKYKESLGIQADRELESRVQRLESAMAAEKDRQAQERSKAAEAKRLGDEGARFEQQTNWAAAVTSYRNSLNLKPDPDLTKHVEQLNTAIAAQAVKDSGARKLRDEAAKLEKQGKLREAIETYRDSLQAVPDPETEQKVKQLETLLDERTKQNARAVALAVEANRLERQGDLENALAKNRESLAIWPTDELTKRIARLETQIAAQKAKADEAAKLARDRQTKADDLWQQGLALLRQQRTADALVPMRQSLEYAPTDNRARYVRSLESQPQPANPQPDAGAVFTRLTGTNWKGVILIRGAKGMMQWPVRFLIGSDNRIASSYRLQNSAGRMMTFSVSGKYTTATGRFDLSFDQEDELGSQVRGELDGRLESPDACGGEARLTVPAARTGIWRITRVGAE